LLADVFILLLLLLLHLQEFFTEMEKQAAEAAKQASKKR
jgi:hypothetical protein